MLIPHKADAIGGRSVVESARLYLWMIKGTVFGRIAPANPGLPGEKAHGRYISAFR
jgi:hypothetical protein